MKMLYNLYVLFFSITELMVKMRLLIVLILLNKNQLSSQLTLKPWIKTNVLQIRTTYYLLLQSKLKLVNTHFFCYLN